MQENQSEYQQKRKSGGGKQPGFQIAAGHVGNTAHQGRAYSCP